VISTRKARLHRFYMPRLLMPLLRRVPVFLSISRGYAYRTHTSCRLFRRVLLHHAVYSDCYFFFIVWPQGFCAFAHSAFRCLLDAELSSHSVRTLPPLCTLSLHSVHTLPPLPSLKQLGACTSSHASYERASLASAQ
jgi:hypothetical protein